MDFNFKTIEEKWTKQWNLEQIYAVREDTNLPKFYILDMFPYPSGAGLHVGHPLGYVASDILARYKKMTGFNVLHPMGFDAFGLPAEQYAIETGTHPEITTEKAIARYREQLDKIGFNYDWNRQVKTSDPAYYKWTQWIFIQLFESWFNRKNNQAESIQTLIAHFENFGTTNLQNFSAENQDSFSAENWKNFEAKKQSEILMNYRLAYQSFTDVNWCPALGTVLANDEIKDGVSERGGHLIEKKKMRQWSLRITEYSDRLLEGLNSLDWPISMKEMQRNWIGKSEGAEIDFELENLENESLKVFTTRPDTLFGVSFMVIAPEHELVLKLTSQDKKEEVDAYLQYVKSRSDKDRQAEKKVTGQFLGSYAIHPFTKKQIPIYIAEYVLAGYGTGAIMAVPAEDERDERFANKFGLSILQIIDKSLFPNASSEDKLGTLINSDFLNGLPILEAIEKMIQQLEKVGIGKRKVNYKQRDAGYSRQRYWGEPFPVKYKNGEIELVSEDELPVVLPSVSSFKPSGDGRSPLANNEQWVSENRETDTMPGYAGSSWYFLRYMDPQNSAEFANKKAIDYWQNVDVYFGGNEHAVGHLLYARFWHKVLFDLGFVTTDEPFKKMVNQGMIGGQSAFVIVVSSWTLQFNDEVDGPKEFKRSVAPFICISKNKFELLQHDINEQTLFISFFDKIMHTLNPNNLEIKLGKNYEWIFEKISAVSKHVPIFLLLEKSDILDQEKYVEWRTSWAGEANIFFYTEDDGTYICQREFEKMSKSKYNVVNPDDVIAQYGADCFRMFEMFLGPIEQSKPWDDKGISGVSSFLRKFWRLFYDENGWKVSDEKPTEKELKILHKTIKKITEDIERMAYNTSVSQFMIATNELQDLKSSKREILQPLVQLLAPFAPFISEELWRNLGNEKSVHLSTFPKFESQFLIESSFTYPISINGKVRANLPFDLDLEETEIKASVLTNEQILKWTEGKELKKFIFVKGRIINVVV